MHLPADGARVRVERSFKLNDRSSEEKSSIDAGETAGGGALPVLGEGVRGGGDGGTAGAGGGEQREFLSLLRREGGAAAGAAGGLSARAGAGDCGAGAGGGARSGGARLRDSGGISGEVEGDGMPVRVPDRAAGAGDRGGESAGA